MKAIKKSHVSLYLLGTLGLLLMSFLTKAQQASITLDFTKQQKTVSPMLYGMMTEEINHAYDGGLYAELIRNRIFKDNKNTPEGWSLVQDDPAAKASIKLIAASEEN